MKPIVFSVLLLLSPTLAWSQDNPESRPPIIDMHLHALDVEDFKETFGSQSSDSQEAYRQKTFAELERYNILAVASGPSDVVQRWKSTLPERIIPGLMFLHPDEVNLDSLRVSIEQGELAVIGEVAAIYNGIGPGDPSLEPIWALAEEYDIPVAIHIGLGPRGAAHRTFPNFDASLGNPLLLDEVLRRHPKLRVYVMHAGWPMLDAMMMILHMHPQVYVDVGVIDWYVARKEFHFYLRRLVDAGFGKQIMFGSDQMLWPDVIGQAIEAIETADFLTEEQKRDIFCHNAARFLRLDPAVCQE